MKKSLVVAGFALAAALAVACSSGPTTYTFTNGTCGPLPAMLGPGGVLTLSGPCSLGSAGAYTLDAGLSANLASCASAGGASTVVTPVVIAADWLTSTSGLIHSAFGGAAVIGCLPNGTTDLTKEITVGGVFVYDGGTGNYTAATGHAFADGGVTASASGVFTANLTLNGSLTY